MGLARVLGFQTRDFGLGLGARALGPHQLVGGGLLLLQALTRLAPELVDGVDALPLEDVGLRSSEAASASARLRSPSTLEASCFVVLSSFRFASKSLRLRSRASRKASSRRREKSSVFLRDNASFKSLSAFSRACSRNATCVEITFFRGVRAESSRRPPRHRRDASMLDPPDTLVDFHTGRDLGVERLDRFSELRSQFAHALFFLF